MTRQVRLLAALILVTAVGLLWPAEIAAQRRPPAGGGGARTGHAVPRTYHSGGGYHSVAGITRAGTTPPGRTIARTTTGRTTTRGSYPYYYAAVPTRPISASALELDSGLAGDRSARRTGMGIPIHIPTAMRRRTRMPSPMRVMGPATPGRTPCRCNSRRRRRKRHIRRSKPHPSIRRRKTGRSARCRCASRLLTRRF